MIFCKPCVEHPLESPALQLNHFEIIRKACDYLKIKESDMLSNSRKRPLVVARMIVVDLLLSQKCFFYTLDSLGKILGGRHHSTIIYNRDELRNWISTDDTMKTLLKNTHLHVFNSLRYFNF